jgi:hypothetical protein
MASSSCNLRLLTPDLGVIFWRLSKLDLFGVDPKRSPGVLLPANIEGQMKYKYIMSTQQRNLLARNQAIYLGVYGRIIYWVEENTSSVLVDGY